MILRKLILTKNNCYITGKRIIPRGIMVHSTGSNNPNLKRYVGPDDGLLGVNAGNNHWNQATPDGRQVCVHAFIGKLADGSVATYQTLPWDLRGWHCGGTSNDTHIGFEICEDGLTDAAYFGRVYQEAVELCAMLCKEYSINPTADGVLICHSEGYKRGIASNHGDVMHWFPKYGKSMDTFRADVKKLMENATAPVQPAVSSTQMYRVRKSWADSKSQIGAYKALQNAKDEADKNKPAGYKVFDESGVVVYDPGRDAKNNPAPASPATTEDIIALAAKHAERIIFANEGSYGSVNKNDNGALSIGKVQWHAGRALVLMKTIVATVTANEKSILGNALYNEITTASVNAWDSRVVTEAEAEVLSALLISTAGVKAQDSLAIADITTYIKKGMSYGLTDCGALIYFSDGVNQYGANSSIWQKIATEALRGAGDATAMWEATKAQTQNYLARRERVYKAVMALDLSGTTAPTEPPKKDSE